MDVISWSSSINKSIKSIILVVFINNKYNNIEKHDSPPIPWRKLSVENYAFAYLMMRMNITHPSTTDDIADSLD
jgi:hypothetical protein